MHVLVQIKKGLQLGIAFKTMFSSLSPPPIFKIVKMETIIGVTKPHMDEIALFHPNMNTSIHFFDISSKIHKFGMSMKKVIHYTQKCDV